MFITGSGLVGGGKIFWLVFSGELSRLIQAQPAGAQSNISPEDVVYFAVGGIALVWLSMETIAKRLATLFSVSELE